MPGQLRMTDVSQGICNHGMSCCPHPIIGFAVTGSPDNQSNNRSSTRAHVDCFIHTCPHCSCGIAIGGSPDTKINNLPAHRNTDIVTDFCGVSISVTSSPDMKVNDR